MRRNIQRTFRETLGKWQPKWRQCFCKIKIYKRLASIKNFLKTGNAKVSEEMLERENVNFTLWLFYHGKKVQKCWLTLCQKRETFLLLSRFPRFSINSWFPLFLSNPTLMNFSDFPLFSQSSDQLKPKKKILLFSVSEQKVLFCSMLQHDLERLTRSRMQKQH